MTAERCPRCDRAECRRNKVPMPAEVRAMYERVLEDPRSITNGDRALARSHSKRGREADEDCDAHVVDWRGEALRLRSELAAAQQRLHRHEHGATIEGDHVCAAELWRANVEPLIEAVRLDALDARHFTDPDVLDLLRAVDALLAATAKEGK